MLPEAPHPDDWILDPDADVGIPFLRCYGRKAVTRLLADPGHHALKRGELTSLVKFIHGRDLHGIAQRRCSGSYTTT
jgi:hypothetical protein